jgi:hypothetical protein
MTDIMQTTLNDGPSQGSRAYPWGSNTFSKSLSSSAIVQEQSIRNTNYTSKPAAGKHKFVMVDFSSLVSPTDIEFDRKMEDQVLALDKQNSNESDSRTIK